MVKRLVKKVNTVKAVKKTKVVKPTKAAKPIKKAVSKKPASKIAQKKPASSKPIKITAAKAKSAKASPKMVVKKPISPSKASPVKKTVEKKPANETELKSKAIKKAAPLPYHKISGEEYMNPKQQDTLEEYMNSKQQGHFREVLLNWRKQLLGEMERTVHHMQDEAANFPDPNDRATQEEEFSLELRARDRERKLIKKIDEALLRLDNHDYGYCEACGVEIGVQRLDARPTATLCIDCKTIDEIREKHFS